MIIGKEVFTGGWAGISPEQIEERSQRMIKETSGDYQKQFRKFFQEVTKLADRIRRANLKEKRIRVKLPPGAIYVQASADKTIEDNIRKATDKFEKKMAKL